MHTQDVKQEDLGSANRVQRNKPDDLGHLTLTRKSGQSFVLGNGVTIEIGEINGARVRLLVTAPPGISIKRSLKEPNNDGSTPQRHAASAIS